MDFDACQPALASAARLAETALLRGDRPFAVAEQLFEEATFPLSTLRSAYPLSGETASAVRQAIEILLNCGRRIFEDRPEAGTQLGQIERWARHWLAALGPDSALEAELEDLHRQWNWRTLG